MEVTAIQELLAGVVDYAGLFPPASQKMRDAVESYSEYLQSDDRSVLGRFIVPVSRLAEMEEAAANLLPRDSRSEAWRLSALVSGETSAAMRDINQFNRRHSRPQAGRAAIDVVELKAVSEDEIGRQSSELAQQVTAYFEIPADDRLESLVDAIALARVRAKIRMGGVTPDAFPKADDVIRFIFACRRAGVPFKATAGLHHPLRGQFRLTYEADSAVGTMYGYLNVFLAAAMLSIGESLTTARDALVESDPAALAFEHDAIVWRGRRLTSQQMRSVREFAISFGSCSFREPIDELSHLTTQTSRKTQ